MINRYYDILGVQRGDSKAAIKRAFRQKAKQYHPDICKAPEGRKKFLEVHEAYAVLTGKKKVKRTKNYRFTWQAPADPDHYEWWLNELKARARQQREAARNYDPRFLRFQKSQRTLADVMYYILLLMLAAPVAYTLFYYAGEVVSAYTDTPTQEAAVEPKTAGYGPMVQVYLVLYSICFAVFFSALHRQKRYRKKHGSQGYF